ncbi:uncharacterized protein [Euwallacea similis]|uniref:uncharacterized protein n=1 Tax=Euwallacea similis TaxID=1736056 RepID=UPI00344C4E05
MGKETRIEVPDLPIAVAQGFGGYHVPNITEDTANLFEEVPSLGIAGDMLMAAASGAAEPKPNFHVGIPEHSEITNNLVGKFFPIGLRRAEIIQRLSGYGISSTAFAEYVPHTRFNLRYIKSLSDILGKFETYRIEKVCFKNLGLAGGETQVIQTRPSEIGEPQTWRERTVQPTSAATSLSAYMGAAYGFQLYKEDGPDEDRAAKVANWSCLKGVGDNPWMMPDNWYQNRNARRNLPPGIGTERFRAISIRQDMQTSNVIRRMIKTPR